MEKVGLPGNGHMMMLERNSADIAKYIGNWLSTNAKAGSGENPSRATPGKAIPTFSTENIARKGFLFAGGSYWGEQGRQVMRGAMYTEVWVPRQVRSPYPIIFFHANGQTGVQWQQTPDNRPGWAYRLVEQGYVVYMVDYPARGRSAYVPLPGPDGKTPIDGNLNIRTALELERIWTNARERGDFPLKMNHTQWPGAGKIGDPIFDNFMRSQVQSAGASTGLARDATIALLEAIGNPVILFAHSQGGGIAFEVTEARPAVRQGDGQPRAGRSAVWQRGHGEGDGGAAQSELMGPDQRALRVRPAGERARRSERGARAEVGAPRRGAVLAAGRTGAQAGAVEEHPGVLGERERHVSPCVRSLHPEVPQSGWCEDRLRAVRGRRHQGQQPRDDAREEQRRHHQVHCWLVAEEREL